MHFKSSLWLVRILWLWPQNSESYKHIEVNSNCPKRSIVKVDRVDSLLDLDFFRLKNILIRDPKNTHHMNHFSLRWEQWLQEPSYANMAGWCDREFDWIQPCWAELSQIISHLHRFSVQLKCNHGPHQRYPLCTNNGLILRGWQPTASMFLWVGFCWEWTEWTKRVIP